MLLATTQVEDFDRFLEIFSTTGAEKRKEHGSKSALVFRDPSEDDRVWIGGTYVTPCIRETRIDRMVPVVARHTPVREVMRGAEAGLKTYSEAVADVLADGVQVQRVTCLDQLLGRDPRPDFGQRGRGEGGRVVEHLAAAQRAEAGVEVVEPGIDQLYRDDETAKHFRNRAMRLNVAAELVTAKKCIARKESVAFAFEIQIVRQPKNLITVLFHPTHEIRRFTGSFLVAALERHPGLAGTLVEIARQGKLDPVIGRDEEIRRVVQVLSRRTVRSKKASARCAPTTRRPPSA